MGHMRAIYDSMTRKERKKPDLLDGTAAAAASPRGAGVELNEVGQFIKQFEGARDMMRAVGGMGMMGKMKHDEIPHERRPEQPGHARRSDAPNQEIRVHGKEGPEQERNADRAPLFSFILRKFHCPCRLRSRDACAI